jgi:hypothetical protein
VVIFRCTSGVDIPLHQWSWSSVIPVVVNFRYNSDAELPFHHWWWSSFILVMMYFRCTSGGKLPLHQWRISVIRILRTFRVLANATFIIACHVMKDPEDGRKSVSSGMVQQKNTSRSHKRLKYPVLCDSQLRRETGKYASGGRAPRRTLRSNCLLEHTKDCQNVLLITDKRLGVYYEEFGVC